MSKMYTFNIEFEFGHEIPCKNYILIPIYEDVLISKLYFEF